MDSQPETPENTAKYTFDDTIPIPPDADIEQPNGNFALHNLHKILEATSNKSVFLTMDKPSADALIGLGLLGTCSMGRSNAVDETNWTPLADHWVSVFPPADDSCGDYMADLVERLEGLVPPAKVSSVNLPGLAELGPNATVANWIKARPDTPPNKLRKQIEGAAVKASLLKLVADEAVATPEPSGCGLPGIVSAAAFTALPLSEPAQVVHGVLHRGSKAAYGGPSKAFKSWTLLDLCIAVATGSEWLGFQTTAGKVLYVNFELQGFALHKRLLAICEDRGITVPENLYVWNLRGFGRPLSALKNHMAGDGYSLVVPDPIYKTLAGRNENDAGAIAEVCAEIESVAITTGAAVAFGAHFAKGNASQKNVIDRMAGSGVFARDPDAILTATTHEAQDAFTLNMTLRNFPQPPEVVIRWQYPRMRVDTALDPAKLKQPKLGRSSDYNVDDILTHLTPGMIATVWRTTCKEECGVGESTFWRLLQSARKSGRVKKIGKGYVLCSTGRGQDE